MIIIAMMSCLANIVTWFICVFATVVSIAITAVLWLTYYDVRNQKDSTIRYSHLEEFIRNETALYALAIIATIVMVCILNNNLLFESETKINVFHCFLFRFVLLW